MITPDFIFSDWIFAWFIIYYRFQRKLGDDYNPYYALCAGLVLSLFIMFATIKDPLFLFYYFIMLLSIKIIPIYLSRKTRYTHKKLVVFLTVFILYNIYLTIRQTTIIQIYKQIFTSLKERNNDTPIFYILSKLH
jgi:hypothetical protein